MASADFAGRLRLHPDGKSYSQIPKHKPLGGLLIHSIDNLSFKELVDTGQHDGIIDHYWTDDGTLLVLTKENPTKKGGVFSALRIFQRQENRGMWLQIHMNEYRYLASHLVAIRDIIVVGNSSGAWVYLLSNLVENNCDGSSDPSEPVELFRCNGVHAMCAAGAYIAVVSGLDLGVWSVDDVSGSQPKTIWCTTLTIGLERATSLVFSKSTRIIALACWDGTVRVFQKQGQRSDWNVCQVGTHKSKWEVCVGSKDGRFPTFAALHEFSVGLQSKDLLAVSTPGSSRVRFFDLGLGTEVVDETCSHDCGNVDITTARRKGVGKAVYGMLATTSSTDCAGNQIPKVLWVDETDFIHKREWP